MILTIHFGVPLFLETPIAIGKYISKRTSPPRPRPGTSLFRVGGGSGYSQGAKKGALEGVNDITLPETNIAT